MSWIQQGWGPGGGADVQTHMGIFLSLPYWLLLGRVRSRAEKSGGIVPLVTL